MLGRLHERSGPRSVSESALNVPVAKALGGVACDGVGVRVLIN